MALCTAAAASASAKLNGRSAMSPEEPRLPTLAGMSAEGLPACAATELYIAAAVLAPGVTTTVPPGADDWLYAASEVPPLPTIGAYVAYWPMPPALHGIESPYSV